MSMINVALGGGEDEKEQSRADFTLGEELAKKVKALQPGQEVTVTIRGKVECLSFHSEGEGYCGRVGIDLAEIKVGPGGKNAFSDLLDDEE